MKTIAGDAQNTTVETTVSITTASSWTVWITRKSVRSFQRRATGFLGATPRSGPHETCEAGRIGLIAFVPGLAGQLCVFVADQLIETDILVPRGLSAIAGIERILTHALRVAAGLALGGQLGFQLPHFVAERDG